MADKREFLAELPLFADLSEAAQEAIARITTEYTFSQGAVIAYQRDVADKFYIVKEGRLFARAIDTNGIARETYSYLPGQYFNDMWLFVPGIHSATIKGAEDGRLLIIEGAPFARLLKEYPAIIDGLAPREDNDIHYGLSEAAWREAQKLKVRRRVRDSSAHALLPEERLEYFTRRSGWLLLGRIIVPILLMVLGVVAFFVIPTGSGLARLSRFAVPIVLGLVSTVWLTLRLIDWRADYFIITNRHLTHHEFDLRHFRIALIKIPIGQVQAVEILKPTFLANLFNIGSARATTAAMAGVILFDNIDNPVEVKNVLERLSGQYRTLESALTQAVMRQSIEKHFGMDSPLKSAEPQPEPSPFRQAQPAGFLARLMHNYSWRVEEGNTITYRKSLFILLRQIGLPSLVFVLLIVLLILGIYLEVRVWVVALVLGIGGLANLGWFIWQLENWHNDVFQLTDRFVIDIDRQPFGFGESRKQAAISNIQNVGATRPGFWATVFNYGFVSVDTAGTKSEIVFDYVPNPEIIQGDIFQRLDEYRRQQRIREGSTRREEYALLLDVYRQAMEQERIPQRTPSDADLPVEGEESEEA
ncbi:cyclic nucleotide-binding domain-containing protein [Promineifilum sp.]|uniref:cyclic nucleotide-binding domain-containing protein n=1 Tax=Promineifilum sp. TaxID=2664178 RepID=UPI0035B1D772